LIPTWRTFALNLGENEENWT